MTDNKSEAVRFPTSNKKPDHLEKPDLVVKTDFGTVMLHLIASITCIISLVTGLRLTADTDNVVFIKWLLPILPQGEIWSWHFYAGLTVFFVSSAYIVYLNRSGLMRRTSLGRIRAITIPEAARKMRVGGFNVLLHWLLYVSFVILTFTGVLMYVGYAGVLVTIHMLASFFVLAYFFAHIASHFIYGGWRQLLRVINPAPLQKTKLTQSKPIFYSLLVGALMALTFWSLDGVTRDEIRIKQVATAPMLDGDLSDAAWSGAQTAMIRTLQGQNLGVTGTRGSSKVWVKGVRHLDRVYFAFKWEDPTRSVTRLPTIKKADGWYIMGNHPDNADESDYYEDKFAILFTKSDSFGNGGTTHMGPRPLEGAPGALNDRGLHYTKDGSMADVWQWKASRGGLLGKVDDMHFGPPKPFSEDHVTGKARYAAGYDNDPGTSFYQYNFIGQPKGGYKGTVVLKRLPKDVKAQVAKLGDFKQTPGKVHNAEGTQWWMTEEETAPYTKELDDQIPVGTILPSTLIMGKYTGDRNDVSGAAKWKDGYWTLEASRVVDTKQLYDLPFRDSLYMYLSVFDNNQTRHTRHARGLKIIFE
jgi:cytochrome b subunit of formate dehydrogenase